MARFCITLTRTVVTRKTVEIDVDEEVASMLVENTGTASFELWANQQAMAAPGDWTQAGPIPTTLSPDISVEVRRIDDAARKR